MPFLKSPHRGTSLNELLNPFKLRSQDLISDEFIDLEFDWEDREEGELLSAELNIEGMIESLNCEVA